MTIYVVRGSTGEYSDRTEWPVCAFTESWKAERFVAQIEVELRRVEVALGVDFDRLSYSTLRMLTKQMKNVDPRFSICLGRIHYWVDAVEIVDEVPVITVDIPKLIQDTLDLYNREGTME